MSGLAFAPSQDIAARMSEGVVLGDETLLPPVDSGRAVRDRIGEFLAASELLILTTKTASGWPITHCMHFGSVMGDAGQPVLYMFSKPDTRKLINVAAEPRVSVMVYAPHNAPDTAKVASLQLRGFCTVIGDKAEHKYSMECQFGKAGYGFSRLLGLHKQPALRIDVVQAIWNDPADERGAVTIEYSAAPLA